MKFIFAIFLSTFFIMPTLMPETAQAKKFYRTTQEINRKNPDYKYIIEIRSSAGWLGGYDVSVQGYLKGSDQKDDNENFMQEWFWGKPGRDTLVELVDGMHLSVREAMDERDWDKIHDEELKGHLDELQKRMREKFESDLQEAMRLELERLKAEQDKNKPMEP